MPNNDNNNVTTQQPHHGTTPPTLPPPLVTICASAPGKVILFGEHAVVHSQPAIAASLSSLRIRITLRTRHDGILRINMPDLTPPLHCETSATSILQSSSSSNNNDNSTSQTHDDGNASPSSSSSSSSPIGHTAMTSLLHLLNEITPRSLQPDAGMSILVTSHNLPVGAGLGSSAAFSVALAAVLLRLQTYTATVITTTTTTTDDDDAGHHHPSSLPLGPPSLTEQSLINQWAYRSEVLIHGTPSGIDNFVSCHGGAVRFEKTTTPSGPNNPKIEKLQGFPPLDILLVDTGVPRSTKVLVAGVKERMGVYPMVMEGLLGAIGDISRQFCDNLKTTSLSYEKLSFLVRTNQHLLRAIGVSHPSLDAVCSLTERYGAATKLTGAGGGGCAVTFVSDGTSGVGRIMTAVEKELGMTCRISEVGGEGVRYEEAGDEEDGVDNDVYGEGGWSGGGATRFVFGGAAVCFVAVVVSRLYRQR